MHMERMQQILDDCYLVKNTPEYCFDINRWFYFDNSLPTEIITSPHCGTAACVIGWHIRLHPDSLLQPDFMGSFPKLRYCDIVFDNKAGFNAIASYLEISWVMAQMLFSASSYTSERVNDIDYVIKRIEHAMKQHIQCKKQHIQCKKMEIAKLS